MPVFTFEKPVHGEGFALTNFAFGPHGIIYADDYPGGTAFEAHQQLVSVATRTSVCSGRTTTPQRSNASPVRARLRFGIWKHSARMPGG